MTISARNEFEPVSAYTTIAGCSIGTESPRQVTYDLIKTLQTVQSHIDVCPFYASLALCDDEETQDMFEISEEIAEHLNYYMPMPEFCSVVLEDSEWRVIPSIESADEECENLEECPDTYVADFVTATNDHGNVTCYQWNPNQFKYSEIWSMV